jgi:pSer/pThr/pTyr-binding forkhead associated (FHA) protein
MNKIIVNLGNVKLDEIPLHRGSLNIGRAADNDISLADAATSAHHAKIVTIFTSSFIQDLNSTNGTIVNGRKVVRHTLHHGDIISIGNLQLLYKSDTKSGSEESRKTVNINKSEMQNLLQKSQDLNKKAANHPGTVRQKENLSGFSISVPSANESNNVAGTMNMQELADAIPILDETLPLSELRKNPDRMVVLTPKTNAVKKPAKEFNKDKQQTTISSSGAVNDHADTALMMNADSANRLDDEQIKQILENEERYTGGSRRIARYAILIALLVIISIAIYLAI